MATRMVDTDVYSFLHGNNPIRKALCKPHLESYNIALSFITVGEQYAGFLKKIRKGEWPESHLEKLAARLKLVAVVPYDLEICKIYGKLTTMLKNPDGSQRVLSSNALWIAA